jgi:lysozyme
MTTSSKGKSLIKKFEGLRLTAYRCAAGVLTIGYGHTTGVTEGMAITEAEAERLLSEDLKQYERAVNNALPTLRQNQFDALVSFTFNLGEANLFSSTLLKKARVNPNDPALRAELMKWVNVNKKPLEGLRKRRAAEADLYFA